MRLYSSARNKINQPGQSLVEFAISLTILLTLLAGAFDFGMAFLDYIALREAAQEGVIFGTVDPVSITGIVERIQQSSDNPIDFSTFVHSPDCSNITNGICIDIPTPCRGNEIMVRVNSLYNLTMPFISAIIGSDSIPLHATVTNVILTPICN